MAYTKILMMKEVGDAMREAQSAYRDYTERSWSAKRDSLKPGEAIPKKGVFYDSGNREAYNNEVREQARRAHQTVAEYVSHNAKMLIKEPTEGELRAVQMFLLMEPDSMSKEDYQRRISDMMENYKESPMTYETLRTHAQKAGVYLDPHPAVKAQEAGDTIIQSIDSFFASKILYGNQNEGGISDGEIAWMTGSIEGECSKIEG